MWKYKTEDHAQAVLVGGTRQDKSGASTGAVFQALAFLLVGLGKRFSQHGRLLVQIPASSWSRSEVRSPAKVSTQSPWLLNQLWTNGEQPALYVSLN